MESSQIKTKSIHSHYSANKNHVILSCGCAIDIKSKPKKFVKKCNKHRR